MTDLNIVIKLLKASDIKYELDDTSYSDSKVLTLETGVEFIFNIDTDKLEIVE